MRSRFLQEIIDSTPKEVDKRVSKWADGMKRAARYEARRVIYVKILKRDDIYLRNYQRDGVRYVVNFKRYDQQEQEID